MPMDTDLHKCAKDGEVSGIMELLAGGCDVNAKGAQGRTALHRALGGGFVEAAVALIDGGAEIAVVDAMKRTSLHWAALCASPETSLHCCALLFERKEEEVKAMVNMQSKSGSTPLHCACSMGRYDVAKLLFEHGGDPAMTDDEGKSSVQYAKENKMPKDLFSAGKAGRGSIVDNGKKKGGLFSKMRRSSTVKDDEVSL